jgi:hypothetical protein
VALDELVSDVTKYKAPIEMAWAKSFVSIQHRNPSNLLITHNHPSVQT